MTSKNEKFKELADKRVNKALRMIRSIAKLSNTNYYEYNGEQVDKIVEALESECATLRKCFDIGLEEPEKFSL